MVKNLKLLASAAVGKNPVCAACKYAKAICRPWSCNSKHKPIKPTRLDLPGDCVSVDQLVSSSPGVIAQMKGTLTKQRFTAATVFVDHISQASYVYLQKRFTSQETCVAKEEYKRIACNQGVRIKHYHANNRQFANNMFKEHV